MGHVEQSRLPRPKPSRDVLDTVRLGGHAPQVAAMVLRAVHAGLEHAKADPGVRATARLLVDLPRLARRDDPADALRGRLPELPADFDLVQLLAAATAELDRAAPPTDAGELARMALAEALAAALGPRLHTLLDPGPDGVVAELARLGTVARFGRLAADFYGRFLDRVLGYVASRGLAEDVGPDARFRTLADERAFHAALGGYCRDAARLIDAYAGGWLSKRDYASGGAITDDDTDAFAAYALTKLAHALTHAEGDARAA
jgi:hypothetical protein